MKKMLVPLMLLVFASFVKAPPKSQIARLKSEASAPHENPRLMQSRSSSPARGRGHVIVDAGHGRKSRSPHPYGAAVAGAGVGHSLSAADRRSRSPRSHAGAVSPRAAGAPGAPFKAGQLSPRAGQLAPRSFGFSSDSTAPLG